MRRIFAKAHAIHQARRLRAAGTDVEWRLWYRLRNRQLGVKFRRQHPLQGFIIDFACEENKLAIELDGGQHADPTHQQRDTRRTEALTAAGWRVLRFWNHDVLDNIDGVLETIQQALTRKS